VLPNGDLRFIRNERYPTKIARDSQGRIMMQLIDSEELSPECDQLRLQTPPTCPAWTVFVVDPVAHTLAHWSEGEMGARVTVDMPLADSDLERAIQSTSELPELPVAFNSDSGKVRRVDLGSRAIDGIPAHGVRTTIESRDSHRIASIHEIWIAKEMKLIVRVIDGDPSGVETVWGLEKVSTHPDSALFRVPAGYELQHQISDVWAAHDFEYLRTWFEK
jgi:hypothetical protein